MARTALESRVLPGGVFTFLSNADTTGSVFFVDSNVASAGNGGTPDTAVATIGAAYTLATASKGDKIYVMPGHAETISADLDIAKIGVQIIGLGFGSNRPTITASGTATQIILSAASVLFANMNVTIATDELVNLFSVTGANSGIERITYQEATSKQLIQFCLLNANDAFMRGCNVYQANAAAANSLLVEIKTCARAVVEDNVLFNVTTNSASSSIIASSATAPTLVTIRRNQIHHTGGTDVVAVNMVANTTGWITDNRVYAASTAIAGQVAAANCVCAENYVLNTVNKSGILDPVVDT